MVWLMGPNLVAHNSVALTKSSPMNPKFKHLMHCTVRNEHFNIVYFS